MSGEGDSSEPKPAAANSPPEQLVIIVTAARGPLSVNLPPSGTLIIGRGVDADVFLASDDASRRHAQLEVAGLEVTIRDLDSRNGTFVNGERLTKPRLLRFGDEIRIAEARLVIKPVSVATSSAPARQSERVRMAYQVTQRSKPGKRE
jgi:pSer/pThr/pTyr-binding forkhead associated (FHA) protein